MSTKAVIFTHIAVKREQAEATSRAKGAFRLMERVKPYFKAYLKCRNVGLVYVYVDVGTRMTLRRLSDLDFETGHIRFSMTALESEVRTRNCFKMSTDLAIHELLNDPSIEFDRSQAPRFQFVGLPHLLSLFNALFLIDPGLILDLAGEQGQLTYDSPKFVEAVIRLVRGVHPIHSRYPIFRFDEDVEVNEQGITELLSAATLAMNTDLFPYDFFSGKYGRADGTPDPVNDYAVRVHWLVDRKSGRFSDKGYHFLRDLGEFGPTQLPTSRPMSDHMRKFVQDRHRGKSANRESPQVISGAGLFMSRSAICMLPPFMNFNNATTWVDDHLKRRLHEAVGHLTEASLEQVPEACFLQNRHPQPVGIRDEDVEWARKEYFKRVLRGCLIHSLIMRPDGNPGLLSETVKEMLDRGLDKVSDEASLQSDLVVAVRATAESLLSIWGDADYGDSILSVWALGAKSEMNVICEETVRDVLAYVRLVGHWPRYVNAIERLTPVQAYWLFRRVEEPGSIVK
jgi:hypothetical protein